MTNKVNIDIKKALFLNKKAFVGIPKPMDFIAYNELYYTSVRDWTIQLYGEEASIYDVIQTMYYHGNVIFFRWFPDLYEFRKEKLGKFFNPTFKAIEGNLFADYLHNLTHIRSKSSHTGLGEAMGLTDNFVNNKVKFQDFLTKYKGVDLAEIEICPKDMIEESPITLLIGEEKSLLFNIIRETWVYQKLDMTFYKDTYKEQRFKQEFPKEKPSQLYWKQPRNQFEIRMMKNLIRALFLEEKFKLHSRNQLYFSETPINQSYIEPFWLIFTDEYEDDFLSTLSNQLISTQVLKLEPRFEHTPGKTLMNRTIKKLHNFICSVSS